MHAAYRVPAKLFPSRERFLTQEAAANTPITEIMVNSIITSVTDGEKVKAGSLVLKGIAWDGGYGIQDVEVSGNGGKSWTAATLGPDPGRFSFREWTSTVPVKAGKQTFMVRASNAIGQTQVAKALFNPAGYHHNVIQRVTLDVA